MPKYMVERHLPGITGDQLSAAAARAKLTTAQMSDEGTPIRYLRSTFVPGEEKCYCLFDGPSADAVEQANQRAEIPYERVVEAMHIASDDLR
ncbi:MAG TPA: DUF4242 domain-containing protein [Kiloniellaceae bacterium]|nr:DUF4242 domain-containing protein [Kiloniellaceae bacterium]HIP77470.1 DUF4242 domain-containing protein [Kiloniellaceae bacterium]